MKSLLHGAKGGGSQDGAPEGAGAVSDEELQGSGGKETMEELMRRRVLQDETEALDEKEGNVLMSMISQLVSCNLGQIADPLPEG